MTQQILRPQLRLNIPFFHLQLCLTSREILKLHGFWLAEQRSKQHFTKTPHTQRPRYNLSGKFFDQRTERQATGT